MERQLELILETSEERQAKLRRYLEPLALPQRQVDLLCLLAGHGEKLTAGGQQFSRLAMDQRRAAKKMGCSKNTFAEAVLDLHAIGVVGVLQNTAPRTYVVNWNRVSKLEPPPPEPELPEWIAAESWSPPGQAVVSAGQGLRDSEKVLSEKVRDRVGDTVNREGGRRGEATEPGQVETAGSCGDPMAHRHPWKALADEHLIAAVVRNEPPKLLRRLYDEAVALGWIDDCEDAKLRFLTICHHCATTAGAHRRVAMLVSRCKRKLDVSRIRAVSEDWAARRLKPQRQAEPAEVCR